MEGIFYEKICYVHIVLAITILCDFVIASAYPLEIQLKEANMGYVRAEEILPVEIIELIQKYVDGTNIYVPRKESNRAGWGQINCTKEKINARDKNIYKEYLDGFTVKELAENYHLSDKSIWRILRKMKNPD